MKEHVKIFSSMKTYQICEPYIKYMRKQHEVVHLVHILLTLISHSFRNLFSGLQYPAPANASDFCTQNVITLLLVNQHFHAPSANCETSEQTNAFHLCGQIKEANLLKMKYRQVLSIRVRSTRMTAPCSRTGHFGKWV